MAAVEPLEDVFPGAHAGSLEVRLAAGPHEVDAAQALRYRIFYEEMSALPSAEMRRRRRDFDRFDRAWQHLLIIDHGRESPRDAIVGTYRLHRCDSSTPASELYTTSEYDIAPVLAQPGVLLELGRMCIDPAYRNGATLQLLWRGVAAYVFHYDVKVMFGCTSLVGTDPDALALPLSYLHHAHLAPEGIRPRALPERHVAMDRMAPDAYAARDALRALPPLVKGYLRLGGFVGDGAVVDRQFGTVDVCMVVKTDLVPARYRAHYERETGMGGFL